jgi:hypothetical protein
MMDVNYFLDDAQNSRQGQFELDFAEVITCFDTFATTLVTECGRTLIITWNPLGFFRDYQVLPETALMKGHPGMAEEIVAMLRHMDVDGETMQYIVKSVGMEEQMLRQLMLTQPINDVEYVWEERRNQ